MKFLRILFLYLLISLAILPVSGRSAVRTVTLPMTIDFPLLRSLVIHSVFDGPDNSAVVMDEGDGCNFIRVADPVFSEANGQLRLETQVLIRTGAPFRTTCLMPAEWIGYVVFIIRPRIDLEGIKLTFHVTDSTAYDRKRQPQNITGVIWDMIKIQTHDFIDGIVVDLTSPLVEIQSVIESFLPERRAGGTASMLDSVRFGDVRITTGAVLVELLAQVEEAADIEAEKEALPFSEKDWEAVIESWETWDAFLVHMILSLAGKSLSESDRRIVFETLLDTRYRITTELADKTMGTDLVREEFLEAWSRLSPVFRNHLGIESSDFTLAYLAFFTAADALATLDQIGPTLGIEISREGLIRFAHLISRGEAVSLEYDPNLNPDLRDVLDLGEPIAMEFIEEPESIDAPKESPEKESSKTSAWEEILRKFFCCSRINQVWASTQKSPPESLRLDPWLPPEGDLLPFIQRTERLLNRTAVAALKKGDLSRIYHDFFKRLSVATAWQESCFRQFIVDNGKVTFLLSYNQTSIGIMQVNRRVWRGIYDLEQLMWNAPYNAAAGCEILEQYLRRYALPNLKAKNRKDLMTEEIVAGIVYAMYNGGPRQFSKFLERKKGKSYFSSDTLFMEKFRWTSKGLISKVESCLR